MGTLPELYGAYLQRQRYGPGDYMQGLLGPVEHQAFTREVVGRNPLMALSLSLGIPAYSLAKLLGMQARSPASSDEVFAGYGGIGQGLQDWYRGMLGG